MRSSMTRVINLSFCLALFLPGAGYSESAGNVTQARVIAEAGKGENWFLNGGNFRGEHYSPLTQIDVENIQSLGLVWSLDLPALDGMSATPIVVDGIIYLSGPGSIVFAIDAASGEMIWTYDPQVEKGFAEDPYLQSAARSNRGVAVWDGKVYVGVADCRLIALNADTGAVIWTKVVCDRGLGYSLRDAPRVGGGKIFVGNSGSESGEKNRGYVSAYDADDGSLLWRFYIVPSDEPSANRSAAMKMAADTWSGDALRRFGGGGSAWNEMTYDPESDLLFFGTAGALPYLYSERSPDDGDNLFTSSVLAVNASSGEYVWHYSTVPQDSWEYNANMNIVLADLAIDGENRQVAMIAPKNGFFYVLDRRNGELISAEKFAKVNWAKRINLETGRPELDPAGSYWEAAEGSTTAIWPNMWGAHSWHAMAYNPVHSLVYVPVIDVPQLMIKRAGYSFDTMELIDSVEGKPHSPGKLVAWDPVTQTARWTVNHELPINGAVLATAGNLVFQGDAQGNFNAFDARDGESLWSVATGSGISAAPVSYRLGDEQHVLVPTGVGGGMQFWYPQLHIGEIGKGPARLLAFSLGGEATMPEVETVERRVANLPSIGEERDTVALGARLYESECLGCHGKNAVARFGGSVPDLRYASEEVFQTWQAIVLGGVRNAKGMPTFDLSVEDSDAIRNFVISEAMKIE